MEMFLIGFGLLYVTWLFYLAVMNLKRAKDAGTISRIALFLGYPVLFVGLLFDLTVNVVVCTVLFLDLPKEALMTARLKRYNETDTGWRKQLALWFASNLLDVFDPSGKHI